MRPRFSIRARPRQQHSAATSVIRQPTTITHGDLRKCVFDVLAKGELEIMFQPVIQLDAPHVAFFEALARFDPSLHVAPDRVFVIAAEMGRGAELEMLAVRQALTGFAALPDGSSISVNVSPKTILAPTFAEQLVAAPLARIILEITENEAIQSYQAIIDVLEPFRQRGLRVAIDDAGAGFASFRHVLQIRPDIIKLDTSICRGLHQDPMRQALVTALVAFGRQIGSDLVAEGVETRDELECLRELGMTMIQGYVFARPTSLGCSSVVLPELATRPKVKPVRPAQAAR